MAPFLLSDKVGEANGTMNTFSFMLHNMVADFESFFIRTLPDGTRLLTEQGTVLRDLVISALSELNNLMQNLLISFDQMNGSGQNFGNILHALLLPLSTFVKIFSKMPTGMLEAIMMFKVLNQIIPTTQLRTLALTMATEGHTLSTLQGTLAVENAAMASGTLTVAQHNEIMVKRAARVANQNLSWSYMQVSMSMMAANGMLMIGFMLMQRMEPAAKALGAVMVVLAGALMGVALAMSLADPSGISFTRFALSAAAGMVIIGSMAALMQSSMTPPDEFKQTTYDMGGRIYDSGGALGGRHFPVMVEPGESIVPKTQNMLGGGGITLNIGGDIVTNDADDFAERIAEALPLALRQQSDIGGI